MKFTKLILIAGILACTAFAWVVLAKALTVRSEDTSYHLSKEVLDNLGSEMEQTHPRFYYRSSTSAQALRTLQPVKSRVAVDLNYEPRKKGLIWYRAYDADFQAEYVVKNPTSITQTIFMEFSFPSEGARYDRFTLEVGDKVTDKVPSAGGITESVILKPGEEISLKAAYQSSGQNQWTYSFGETRRVRDFALTMKTNFEEINMPAGTESPTERLAAEAGWGLDWTYSDVIGARSIGMDMPAVVNPGPVAARITYFAPVSLLFFFAVLVIVGMVRGVDLHPMNYFFLAAGCFAFQLLFAYLVDLMPIMQAFSLSATVSLVLVSGYLWLVAGGGFARIAALAQFAYMILFSYSFFYKGLTGITITVGAVVTLALLMVFTAKVDWNAIFSRKKKDTTPDLGNVGDKATPPPLG